MDAQKAHRHEYWNVYPAITGPARGPSRVAEDQSMLALPLTTLSTKTSAIDPPVTLIGGEANVPLRNLKIRKAAQLGERAVPMVKIV